MQDVKLQVDRIVGKTMNYRDTFNYSHAGDSERVVMFKMALFLWNHSYDLYQQFIVKIGDKRFKVDFFDWLGETGTLLQYHPN